MGDLGLKISNKEVHFKKGIEVFSKYSPQEKEKLEKASKEFESMLTRMMINSMTKTTDGLLGKDNYGGDVLDVLFETEISNHITNNQGLGVADQIFKSLTGESLSKERSFSKEKFLNTIIPNDIKNEVKDLVVNKVKPSNSALKRIEKYNDLIDSASKKFNVDAQLIKSVILTESAGKANAISSANAKGLMQLMDSTASDMGVDNPWNPKENIDGGTKYLSKLLKSFEGNRDLALAAYNAGPSNVKKYDGIPPFKETQNYVKRVNNYLNSLE